MRLSKALDAVWSIFNKNQIQCPFIYFFLCTFIIYLYNVVQRSYHAVSLPVVPTYNVLALFVRTKERRYYNTISFYNRTQNPFKTVRLVFRGVDNHDAISPLPKIARVRRLRTLFCIII